MTEDDAILARFDCVDCAVSTHAICEYYMVTDELWTAAGMEPRGGMLCIGCLETRIGRRLGPADFPRYPVNHGFCAQSERLQSRIHCERIAA